MNGKFFDLKPHSKRSYLIIFPIWILLICCAEKFPHPLVSLVILFRQFHVNEFIPLTVVMYVCMCVNFHCQVREKFASLKKNARGDVVAALEEVVLHFYYVMTN